MGNLVVKKKSINKHHKQTIKGRINMSWDKIETYHKIAYGAGNFDKELLDE